MFCYQCEQTSKGAGCQQIGVCGKQPETAALQDLLVHATKGLSMYAHREAQLGVHDAQVDRAMLEGLFATVTNVDFDPARIEEHPGPGCRRAGQGPATLRGGLRPGGQDAEKLAGPAAWQPAADRRGLVGQGRRWAFPPSRRSWGPTLPACWN